MRRDLESTDVAGAAWLARETDPGHVEPPLSRGDVAEFEAYLLLPATRERRVAFWSVDRGLLPPGWESHA